MKPLDRAVQSIAAHVRRDETGTQTLAHVLVVMPTAQAARRMRQALAERFGAIVPPLFKTPADLRLNLEDPALAGRTDELMAFHAALGEQKDPTYDIAAQLSDLRTILAPNALTFADVAARLKTDMPDEAERWEELARLEKDYLAFLAAHGKRDRIVLSKEGVHVEGIETTLRFDDLAHWLDDERPEAESEVRAVVVPSATPADEARQIAEYFAAVKDDEELPALCVADPEMFPEIETAFKAKGLKMHNPAETRLVSSSLGHLVAQLDALLRTQSYGVFSGFLRGGDGRRWIKGALELSDEEFTAMLEDLDNRQAEFLPEKIDDIAPRTQGKLRAVFEFIKVQLRKKGMRELLAAIFRDYTLDAADPAAREFAAAAEVVNNLITECGENRELFRLRLEEATYSLEPDEGDVILTDGWLELPFVTASEIVIAGFAEGCVPESTVGHPFAPDGLRRLLGLPDNAFKERRDRAILRAITRCRAAGNVRISFHSITTRSDTLKPSRLLLETADDRELVQRVRRYYGIRPGTAEGATPDLPNAWRLKLPVPPARRELTKSSPTRIDGYLRCPFTYYLNDKTILGDKRMNDRAEELESWEYGNLAHAALEAFGTGDLKDATDAAAIADFLAAHIDGQLAERFGASVPAIVALQGESAKRRLRHFAAIQAARRAEGWRIVAAERKLEIQYGHTRLSGKCDRIDYNDARGEWCVIDYKTWDKAGKAESVKIDNNSGSLKWLSLQLPIYCAMLDALNEPAFAAAKLERISSCYCVLGKTKDDVLFSKPMRAALVPEAEKLLKRLIAKIERGIFWPPAKGEKAEWMYNFKDLLTPDPAQTVDAAWIDDQNERLAALEAEEARKKGAS